MHFSLNTKARKGRTVCILTKCSGDKCSGSQTLVKYWGKTQPGLWIFIITLNRLWYLPKFRDHCHDIFCPAPGWSPCNLCLMDYEGGFCPINGCLLNPPLSYLGMRVRITGGRGGHDLGSKIKMFTSWHLQSFQRESHSINKTQTLLMVLRGLAGARVQAENRGCL